VAALPVEAGHVAVGARGSTGHASAAMTLDTYADLFDDDLDAVSSAVDDASRAAAVPQPKSRKAPARVRVRPGPRFRAF
jgi:hypothetical protein